MAKDKYFDLRQSTRAYQNPYEAGGIGVGGLTESARYNRLQVGASFLSAPTGVNTWSKKPSSRSMGRRGMADMPTDGPTPLGGPPDRPQKMGPAGPPATAAGVAGRFERPSENTFTVTGKAGQVAGKLVTSGFVAGLAARRARQDKRDRLKGYEDYDLSATLAAKRQGTNNGTLPTPKSIGLTASAARGQGYSVSDPRVQAMYNEATNEVLDNTEPYDDVEYVRRVGTRSTTGPAPTGPAPTGPAPAVTPKPSSRTSGRSVIAESIDKAQASGFDPIASANRAEEELARRQGRGASSPNQDFNDLYDKLYGNRPYDWGLDKEEGGLG